MRGTIHDPGRVLPLSLHARLNGVRTFACVLLAATFAAACHRGPRPLARVGARVVTVAQVEEYLRRETGREPGTLRPELAQSLLGIYLTEEVLLASGSGATPASLSADQRSALARQRLGELCPPPPPPSDAAVDALAAGPDEAPVSGERLLLRQLILPDAAAARSARERLLRNEDFLDVSRAVSRAPNAATGGMLGWVERGQLPPEFEAALASLPPAGISVPVVSDAGWHVFQVMERRAGAADDEIRQRSRRDLAAREAEAAQRACLARLVAAIEIHVDCRGATFPCRNPFEEKS